MSESKECNSSERSPVKPSGGIEFHKDIISPQPKADGETMIRLTDSISKDMESDLDDTMYPLW